MVQTTQDTQDLETFHHFRDKTYEEEILWGFPPIFHSRWTSKETRQTFYPSPQISERFTKEPGKDNHWWWCHYLGASCLQNFFSTTNDVFNHHNHQYICTWSHTDTEYFAHVSHFAFGLHNPTCLYVSFRCLEIYMGKFLRRTKFFLKLLLHYNQTSFSFSRIIVVSHTAVCHCQHGCHGQDLPQELIINWMVLLMKVLINVCPSTLQQWGPSWIVISELETFELKKKQKNSRLKVQSVLCKIFNTS